MSLKIAASDFFHVNGRVAGVGHLWLVPMVRLKIRPSHGTSAISQEGKQLKKLEICFEFSTVVSFPNSRNQLLNLCEDLPEYHCELDSTTGTHFLE